MLPNKQSKNFIVVHMTRSWMEKHVMSVEACMQWFSHTPWRHQEYPLKKTWSYVTSSSSVRKVRRIDFWTIGATGRYETKDDERQAFKRHYFSESPSLMLLVRLQQVIQKMSPKRLMLRCTRGPHLSRSCPGVSTHSVLRFIILSANNTATI